MQLVSLILIRWIVIYPGDSAIQRLSSWGQGNKRAKFPEEGAGGGGGGGGGGVVASPSTRIGESGKT